MNRRLVLLISIAGLLGAYVAGGELFTGSDPERATGTGDENQSGPAAPATASGPSAKLNPLEGLAPESFSAMLERPLFNPGRTPRPVEAPPPPPPSPEETPPPPEPVVTGPNGQDFKLIAIAAGPFGRVAALRLAVSGEVLHLREGDRVNAWTVIAVNDRSIVIGTTENNVTLRLFERDESL